MSYYDDCDRPNPYIENDPPGGSLEDNLYVKCKVVVKGRHEEEVKGGLTTVYLSCPGVPNTVELKVPVDSLRVRSSTSGQPFLDGKEIRVGLLQLRDPAPSPRDPSSIFATVKTSDKDVTLPHLRLYVTNEGGAPHPVWGATSDPATPYLLCQILIKGGDSEHSSVRFYTVDEATKNLKVEVLHNVPKDIIFPYPGEDASAGDALMILSRMRLDVRTYTQAPRLQVHPNFPDAGLFRVQETFVRQRSGAPYPFPSEKPDGALWPF
jgi:hypothetical protein